LSKVGNGFIFPSKKELLRLQDPENSNFCVEQSISYSTYEKKFKAMCTSLLTRKGSKFGSHTARKTFYLFGTWLKGNMEILMRDARHKTLKNAQTYARDARKYSKMQERCN
jgi:hypothetical protein